jgi:DNA methyltransferase 1-associated protein 1
MDDGEDGDPQVVSSSEFAKYNVEVELPQFTDEEYDAYLRNNDWSREETDYLLQLVKDYYYRWAVIWDRYDFQPGANSHLPSTEDASNGDSTALATLPFAPPKTRTVEDLKARFYDMQAKLMKLRIPEVQMDADQYALYETLSKFNPDLERNRKNLASALMNRNMDEVKEEEFLLTELQRINMAANRLDAERAELRARLEAPSPNAQHAAGLQAFQSSQALGVLFNQLFQQDRSKKRASGAGPGGRLSLSANDIIGTPTSAQHAQMSSANRRQSMAQPPAQTPVKQLSPNQEQRYNVSTHDRLTSGVTFGSDKLLKMRQAKSNVQTQKIAAALTELGIGELISIPTDTVGTVFEGLIGKVGKLLDIRKVREKEEGECRVLEAMKARRAGDGGEDSTMIDNGDSSFHTGQQDEVADSQSPDADGEEDDDADGDADADADADEDAEGEEDEDAEGEDESEPQVTTRHPSEAVSSSTRALSQGHKRSASVMSQSSTKSSKRARKLI